nr:hypothetical protein [Tanacetum cinerariifolium]
MDMDHYPLDFEGVAGQKVEMDMDHYPLDFEGVAGQKEFLNLFVSLIMAYFIITPRRIRDRRFQVRHQSTNESNNGLRNQSLSFRLNNQRLDGCGLVMVLLGSVPDPEDEAILELTNLDSMSVGERVIKGPEMIEVTNKKVAVAKEKLKEARTRQKSYADMHRRSVEFQPGDRVLLEGITCTWSQTLRGYKYHPLHVISYPRDQIRADLSYVGERVIEGPKMIEVTNEKVIVAKEKLKEARTLQKSYANKHRKSLEFQPGDRVFLKVSPARGVRRFGIKGKLSPRFIGPFEILDHVGYKYHPLHVISYPLDQIRKDLSYVEEPEAILDCQDRVMRNKTIPFVKILWRNHPERKATWETEESIRTSYPHFLP